MNKGILCAISAYMLWGLLPIYWKSLNSVPALQILCHRIAWSFVVMAGMVLVLGQGKALLAAMRTPRVYRAYGAAAALIGINWLIYIWAVNAGCIVETSLGYFINPLLSVLLGVVFLGERLRPGQWPPIALAAAGVLYLTWAYGLPPWIALALAASFGTYGLVKKIAPLGALFGLTLETGALLLPALAYLAYAKATGTEAFMQVSVSTKVLLVGTGLATSVPLLLFSAAARRIPLSLTGILQYIAPTLQFLIGVMVYHEPFTAAQAICFCCVWSGLFLYTLEGVLYRRAQVRPAD